MGPDSSENLSKLRALVDELESSDNIKHNDSILKEISNLIEKERKIINGLKRSDVKIKHYEGMCTGILSLISTVDI